MPNRWASALGMLAVWLVLSVFVGFSLGSVAWGLFAGCFLYLIRTLWQVYVLDRALHKGGRTASLATRGLWAELYARTDALREKSRERKRRYLRLVREIRGSTGALTDAGIILNADWEIVWFNPAASRLIGLDPARDIGQRIDNLLRAPAFVDYLNEPHRDAITMPSPVAGGDTLWVRLIPYGQDQYIAIARDVTHEFNLARTRRDFVANASHELRSPLTVIGGYLDTLAEDEELPESWTAPIQEMQRQAHRMTQILRDLIELTRLEAADAEAKKEFVSVIEQLRSIVELFENQEEHPSIELELETDAALLGSESELHSIFFNIINNAMRFTPVTGRVTVRWKCEKGEAVFEVEDNGIGIAEEVIPRLTERFYRVDPGRSRATGGTGLGLAIVKHALQRHGAELRISSVEGEGSHFLCRFPHERVIEREGSSQAVV